ncbi:MAG TPA: DUF3617 domain-containing protein [Acetobacteraceae bacterium]|jgi:hypothetical protein|nr:DUF3617 domain-containing protein [Acetobacteraceae bacterium]
MNICLRRVGCIAGLTMAVSNGVFASGLSLDVTPGLWQISTAGSASGVPNIPPSALAKMSPQQRAMAEAMAMVIVSQANIPHELQICITPEQIRQGFDLNRVGHNDCVHDVRSSSPTHLDMHVTCTGKDQLDGTVHLTAIDRTTVSGDLDLRAGDAGTALTIRQTLHGKWLGAACGDVRPIG